jgi:hypothetical protein
MNRVAKFQNYPDKLLKVPWWNILVRLPAGVPCFLGKKVLKCSPQNLTFAHVDIIYLNFPTVLPHVSSAVLIALQGW